MMKPEMRRSLTIFFRAGNHNYNIFAEKLFTEAKSEVKLSVDCIVLGLIKIQCQGIPTC